MHPRIYCNLLAVKIKHLSLLSESRVCPLEILKGGEKFLVDDKLIEMSNRLLGAGRIYFPSAWLNI